MSRFSDPIRSDDDQGEASSRLRVALSDLYAGPIDVPPSLDAAMRRAIHAARFAEAAQRRQRGFARRVLPWAGAVAALVAITTWLAIPQRVPQGVSPMAHQAPRGDFDHNGRVDILDAYYLARQIADASAIEMSAFDLNGDGLVNDADVNAVAMQAVALDGPREDGATS